MTMQEFIFLCEAKQKRYEHEEYNANFRNATLCALLANIYRDTQKQKQPFEIKDFMPKNTEVEKEKEIKKPIDVNVMAEMFYAFTEANGGVTDR
jgi:hypothetical protein